MVAKLLVAVQEMCFHLLEVGPDVGLGDRNLLEAAVERPRQRAFGDDTYPTHASKAAALLKSLARNHPFVDANKQIAVLASFVFLELNGHTVETSNDDVVSTVSDLITRNIDFAEPSVRIERWITSSAAG